MGRRTWHCGQTAAGISWRKGEPEPAACKTPPQSLKPDHGAIAVDKMGIGPRGNLANFSPSFRSLRLPCCQNGSLFDRSVGGPISLITSSEGTLPSSWTCCVLLSWLSLLRCVPASLSPPSSCCPTFQPVFACTNPVSGCGLTSPWSPACRVPSPAATGCSKCTHNLETREPVAQSEWSAELKGTSCCDVHGAGMSRGLSCLRGCNWSASPLVLPSQASFALVAPLAHLSHGAVLLLLPSGLSLSRQP